MYGLFVRYPLDGQANDDDVLMFYESIDASQE